MKRPLIVAGALVALLQLAVPVTLALRYERTLRDGRAFKVKIEQFDPADAFRGRYLWLNLMLPATVPVPETFERRGWAVLDEGPDGYARATAFSWDRPNAATAVPARIAVRYVPIPREGVPDSVPDDRPWDKRMRVERQVALLLDRYYVNESRAQRAQDLTRVHPNPKPGETREAWAVVRVEDGLALIEGVWVDGRRIEDAAR